MGANCDIWSGGRGPGPSIPRSWSFSQVRVQLWSRKWTTASMSHVQKRLAATASRIASVSPAYLKSFPPKEAFAPKPSSSQSDPSVEQKPHFFDAETWASLQPPPPTSLTAFAYRIGVGKLVSSPDPILQACTHPSFLPLHQRHYPHHSRPAANERLAVLGNSLMGLFAAEYVNSTYPYLPTRVMKAAVSAYVGPTTCATIAKEMGATPLLRWNRVVRIFRSVSHA